MKRNVDVEPPEYEKIESPPVDISIAIAGFAILLIILLICCSGCAMMAKSQLPTVLMSREQQWTIPAGTKFIAIQKPKYDKLTEFAADEDLAVVYKGNLLELEQEANSRAIKSARTAKTKGVVLGSLGSILTILAGLFGKGLLNKIKKK